MKIRTALVGLILGFTAVAGSAQQSAWDAFSLQNPDALFDGDVGPLEARVLDALTPDQAQAWADGADPSTIFLEDGSTLADLLSVLLAGGKGLVYVPLDSCVVVRTVDAVAGAMTIGETRQFIIRGETTDLSAQGGSASGCGVPAEAVAVVLHLRTLVRTKGVPARLLASRVDGPINPTIAMEYKWTSERRAYAGVSVIGLCEGACASGEFELTTVAAGAHVRSDVIGYFRPIEASDLPPSGGGGVDADTLDGLDSTAFALDPHTHAGEDITSGTVADARIDAAIARDSEVFGIVLTSDGSGSGLDSDLLDGRDSLDLMLQVGNCLTVSPNCPAAAPDALAARCWQTVSAALAAINGTDLPLATTTNRYQIKVGPGIYTEQVVMKAFVDIEGAGQKPTTITNAGTPTLEGADNAQLSHLTVENTGGGIAIQNSAVSPMIKYVTAVATGGVGSIGVKNGMGAAPMLTHVTTSSDGDGVENSGASVTVRDSILAGTVNGIENATSTAAIVNAQILGGADDGATQTTFTCLGAYDGTFTELDSNCQ